MSNNAFSNKFTEHLTYDKNGNVKTLQRYGATGLIDDMEYRYEYSGNQVRFITDRATAEGFPLGTLRFGYDANGNMTSYGQSTITYNLLNLPEQIQLSGGRIIKNTYTTDGRKLFASATENNQPVSDGTWYYNGNLVFDINGELEYILMPEGRILNNNGAFEYEYHLKDHLGSVRVAFVPTVNGKEVVQENAYYPFGATIADLSYYNPNLSTNRYKRESKEYITDFSWNKHDYGARTFDLWNDHSLQIDPLAEKFYHISPYAIFLNNPMRLIDPTGMEVEDSQKEDKIREQTPELNLLERIFYGWVLLLNWQGQALNQLAGQTETTFEENVQASIEHNVNLMFVFQGHLEMSKSIARPTSSNRATPLIVEEASATPVVSSTAKTGAKSLGAAAKGFSKGNVFIKGVGNVERNLFHSTIKPDILKAAGNFGKTVGSNPDIAVQEGLIILKGTGPYSGKTFQTGLNALDFFGF